MSSSTSTHRASLTVLLAALVGSEAALMASDAGDGVRYGVGAVVAVAILFVVARIARAKSSH
ncbi:hypothetical protein [Streptomyces incanus]|uniref:Uncharacterized protein n=1 Tax=Streptomyces incanus TaxID=887453 RepID=A0ABW0XME4_9ACTN